MQGQLDSKKQADLQRRIEKEKQEGTRPFDSSDKIAGDQALQMLVNSEPQKKLNKLQQDKKDNLAAQTHSN
jgi:hypothetical protein